MPADDLIAEIQEAADRHLEASSTLIAVHLFAAGCREACAAIGATAGYLVGSRARAPSKPSVLRFAERYLPELGRERLDGCALADHPGRPVESCAELVYEASRGGLLHDGEREGGVRCVDDRGRWMLRIEPDGAMALNAIPFQAQFERGLRQYLKDLRRDPDVRRLAARRSAFLARPLLRFLPGGRA